MGRHIAYNPWGKPVFGSWVFEDSFHTPPRVNCTTLLYERMPIQSIKIIKVVFVIIYSPSFSFSVETGYVLNSFKSSSSSVVISNFGAISEKVKSENKSSFSISSTVLPSCSMEMILS